MLKATPEAAPIGTEVTAKLVGPLTIVMVGESVAAAGPYQKAASLTAFAANRAITEPSRGQFAVIVKVEPVDALEVNVQIPAVPTFEKSLPARSITDSLNVNEKDTLRVVYVGASAVNESIEGATPS